MKYFLFWLLQASLIIIQLTCSSCDMLPARRVRSSGINNTSQYISDNLWKLMENKPTDNSERQPDQHQHQYQIEAQSPNVKRIPDINDTIHSLFHVGPDVGFELFRTLNEDSGSPDHKYVPAKYTVGSTSDNDSNPCEYVEGQSKHQSYCTKVKSYLPKFELEYHLQHKFSNLEFFSSVDEMQPKISQRMSNNDLEQKYLCKSEERVIYPESAETKDKRRELIPNNLDFFKQGVRIEECVNEGQWCEYVTISFNYEATCQQNYTYREMVAIKKNGTIFKDHFKFPSCCQCVVKKQGHKNL